MTEYYLPAGYGTAEHVEKKSRFIGQVWPILSEEEAREKIQQVKKKYHDARHSCWCFCLRDGTMRYSDDGEPQGTAGQPMLTVFTRSGITDALCVVTRYFGGVLLGTGGLVRAYSKAAKDALSAAGISVERCWDKILVVCPYGLYDRLRQETENMGGIIDGTEFGADVTMTVLAPEEVTAGYLDRLTEMTGGKIQGEKMGQIFRSVRIEAF